MLTNLNCMLKTCCELELLNGEFMKTKTTRDKNKSLELFLTLPELEKDFLTLKEASEIVNFSKTYVKNMFIFLKVDSVFLKMDNKIHVAYHYKTWKLKHQKKIDSILLSIQKAKSKNKK